MSETTIGLPEELRDRLRDERLPHESSYADTIARLLGEDSGGQLWTEQEIEDMIQRQIESVTRRYHRDE